MPGFQPRITTDHVWYDGTDIHTYNLATGLGIRITEIRGWDDSVDVRDTRQANAGRDGERPLNFFLGGRTITVAGVVHGSTWVDLQDRKRDLEELLVPQEDEVLFKIPDPATASPTGTYATTGMTGYERSSVRVIEDIVFGDMVGSCAMKFQVSLRASDPLIYSDVETTDTTGGSANASPYTGRAAAPYVLSMNLRGGASGATYAGVSEPNSRYSPIWLGDCSAFNDTADGTVPEPRFVLDVGNRDPYFQLPHAKGRLATLSPLALWKFNEAAGVTADNAEGTAAYDGTISGTPTMGTAGPFTGSKSLTLDGVNDRVAIAYTAAMHPTEFTLEGFVKFTQAAATGAVWDSLGTASRGVRIHGSTSLLVFSIGTGSAERVVGYLYDVSAPWSEWTHVAITHKDGVVRCYVNGECISTVRSTYAAMSSGTTYFGYNSNSGAYMAGLISTWTVYGRALSAAELDPMASMSTGLFDWRAGAGAYIDHLDYRDLEPGADHDFFAVGDSNDIDITYRDARR